ncbi:hypothetical protein [Streptomyces bugieae]|uniref:ATP-grasp-modified RiPP n=1 Tax=Streptomyces bugieae TaxID=3098223 RepID=A0ABU7NZZ9_9ACTN|nr:hypothetical protein [Streptomyces sp. DSM 41528]
MNGPSRRLTPRQRPPHRVPLPRHRSPYAYDALSGPMFIDTPLRPVRPYQLAGSFSGADNTVPSGAAA